MNERSPPGGVPQSAPMIHLVLAESALELVPEALWNHPAVTASARKRNKPPGQILLDDTLHHSAMADLAKKGRFDEPKRRGRPDILHLSLLVALESRANKTANLRVWVHTRDDIVLELHPQVRLPRNQQRFYGVIESALIHGRVPPQASDDEDVLIRRYDAMTLPDLVAMIGAERLIVFDEAGTQGSASDAWNADPDSVSPDKVCCIVGGFPSGQFSTPMADIVSEPHVVRLGDEALTAWTVAGEIVAAAIAEPTLPG